jgi:hypothetical protein
LLRILGREDIPEDELDEPVAVPVIPATGVGQGMIEAKLLVDGFRVAIATVPWIEGAAAQQRLPADQRRLAVGTPKGVCVIVDELGEADVVDAFGVGVARLASEASAHTVDISHAAGAANASVAGVIAGLSQRLARGEATEPGAVGGILT